MGIAAEILQSRNQQEKEDEQESKQSEKVSKLDDKTNNAADKILDEGVLGGQLRLIADASAAEAEATPEVV